MFSFFQGGVPQTFCYTYKCFSVSMFPGAARQDVENGGKIILPPAALEHLTRLNVVYPMLFKITHRKTNRVTHCGVLEFVADHSKCYVPYWMMRNILCEEGDLVDIESATLPVANFSKFQPISTEFLDISNPKAILENALRNFACLTTGDCVAIRYNDKVYELRVLETKPGNAVSIIECDMDVEFAPPDDYVEPARVKNEEIVEKDNAALQTADVDECERNFLPFIGSGNRLDGKHAGTELESASKRRYRRGIPDYEYKMGTIEFIRTSFSNGVGSKASTKSFVPFAGGGITIRGSTRNEKSDACAS